MSKGLEKKKEDKKKPAKSPKEKKLEKQEKKAGKKQQSFLFGRGFIALITNNSFVIFYRRDDKAICFLFFNLIFYN